ncbi:MarR family winged helix-turn-helix transcriptional regulator [Actinoplanes sp. NPDC000266]
MISPDSPIADGERGRLLDEPCDRAGIDVLAQTAILSRAGQLVRRHLENTVLRGAHLTWNSFDVLQLVVSRRPIDTRTVAAITGLAKPTVSVISTDLAARHLIRRARHRLSDPVAVRLYPTTAAAELVARLRPLLAAAVGDLRNGRVDGLDPVAVDLLRRLITT